MEFDGYYITAVKLKDAGAMFFRSEAFITKAVKMGSLGRQGPWAVFGRLGVVMVIPSRTIHFVFLLYSVLF